MLQKLTALLLILLLSSCGSLIDHIRERQQATRTKDDKGRIVKIEIPDGEDVTVIKEEETKVKVDYFKDKWGIKLNGNENLKLLQSIDEWLGVPYKDAGTTKIGVDCSGLTKAIYKEVYNIDLARRSHDVYLQSVEVSRSSLTDGDLIFFKLKYSEVSHVGIYISNGNFVHASSSSGVIISNLSEKYYTEGFYKAGRIERR